MKTTTVMILGLICMNILAFSTYPLTVDEIRKHNNRHKGTGAKSCRVYRGYRRDSETELKRRHFYHSAISSEFCEALVNTVVRLKTAHLRSNLRERNTELSWSQRKGPLYMGYKCEIENGMIVREECTLSMKNGPDIKTVNGKITGNISSGGSSIQKLLKKLEKHKFNISEVRMRIPNGTTHEAVTFINSIGLNHAIISESGRQPATVFIKFKNH